ncbi:hypothetical protein NHX12_008306 [Muraenolepis orangiensis]|uniref:Uncharacterized protein n=1 Tax=Muraenolepis orangiensis TaxID=630683 RepID=A0A9Q0DL09_9TELE|nr:hypothetical protein NHX12_008306 [Muraenolepis orangiensis]
MSQEASKRVRTTCLRTTCLRTPVDSRAHVLVHNGSEKGHHGPPEDPVHDLGSGDTGFFDSPKKDESDEGGVVHELQELDRLVAGGAAVSVQGEE